MKTTLTLLAVFAVSVLQAAPYSVCPGQWTTPPPPCEEECCPPGANGGAGGGGKGGGCSSCKDGGFTGFLGMPVWKVWESQVDYRILDTPLRYEPAYGPPVSLDLVYQTWRITDVDYYPDNEASPLFGPQWHCAWSSDIVISNDVNGAFQTYWNYLGSRIIYTGFSGNPSVSAPAFNGGSRLQIVTNGVGAPIGGKIYKRDGSVLEYFQAYSGTQFLITSIIDANGKALTLSYDGFGRLNQITAATGETTTMVYGFSEDDRFVTQVNAPGGYSATFQYGLIEAGGLGQWQLTNITDTVGITSTFTYRPEETIYPGPLVTMTTPYGTTRFEYLAGPTNAFGLSLLITEPNLGQHLYVQAEDATPPVPSTFDSGVIPSGLPIGTLDSDRQERNTFHWGPLQMASIGNLDVHNWSWTEFKRAHIRHWLGQYDIWDGHRHISDTLSWEQAPSPDGTTEGQVTWYDYAGKDPMNLDKLGTGTQLPSVIAKVLPNGTTSYQYNEYNSLGKLALEVETYTKPDGSIGTRTNTFQYAANLVDMTRHLGPQGEQVTSNRFDELHQITNTFNALDELTTYRYNANGQLIKIQAPTDLTTTNIYFSAGGSIGRLEKTIDLEINRTNAFTYHTSGLVQTKTDERGLAVNHFWDGLSRLIGTSYPDGSTTTNLYHRGATKLLDIVAMKDRGSNWIYFDYNGIRQKTAETNANGVVTRYGYCDCGSMLSLTNGWGTAAEQWTTFWYDYQGNRTHAFAADGYNITNRYDSLGRLVAVADGWGTNSYDYNHQGLLATNRNAFGTITVNVYDVQDRPIYVTDANSVTVTNTYDALGRLRTRANPDGGTEHFGYSARGLVAHTNQLNATNFYVYDPARRKTFETNANLELIQYRYNSAGNLTNLIDGKAQSTKWKYDAYGRVTNKLDQAGVEVLRYQYDTNDRLTNRWSKEKGNTAYKYDSVGNLTNINYPVSTDVTFQYDWLDRLTNMVDAAGITKYTYTAGNQLLTEDGPSASDTVTNGYLYRMRTNLTLLQPTGLWTNGFGYDTGRRLTNVISKAGTFTYQLASSAPSLLPIKLTLPNTAYITNNYDSVARLAGTSLKNSSHSDLDSYVYVYSAANQRSNLTRTDSSTVAYSYDKIGQLKTGNSSINSEDRTYAYDAAWNLDSRTKNGALETFSVDSKNQLSGTPSGATSYDDNGNLTFTEITAGELQCAYDDENRLTSLYRLDGASDAATEFVYDGLGRLRTRVEYLWDFEQEEWVHSTETRYIYDGNRVIQERNSSNVPQVSYTRGTDLSGTLEEAGGIGGLLARSHGYSSGNWSTHNFYHSDGNGNITYLVNSSQTLAASYRYDPFGNTISKSGTLADDNVYRFSSKEIHLNSGMYYYLYRFYDPNLQRWINRDPLEELGGWNLYRFAMNNPLSFVDRYGDQPTNYPLTSVPPLVRPPVPPVVPPLPDPNPGMFPVSGNRFKCKPVPPTKPPRTNPPAISPPATNPPATKPPGTNPPATSNPPPS